MGLVEKNESFHLVIRFSKSVMALRRYMCVSKTEPVDPFTAGDVIAKKKQLIYALLLASLTSLIREIAVARHFLAPSLWLPAVA